MEFNIVTSVDQAIENIRRYNKEIKRFVDLMPKARSWYAFNFDDGWMLAPSKIIGYQNLKPQEYLARDVKLDGRVTESVLQSWAELVEIDDARYEALDRILRDTCARNGKKPNSLARISVLIRDQKTNVNFTNDSIVKLMHEVYKELSPAQKSYFKNMIK